MNKGLILIVEDDVSIRESLSELLDLEGFAFQVASDGFQAISLLTESERKPDAILLDLMMPVCSGYAFLEIIKDVSDLKSIPIIIMSAAANAEETARAHHLAMVKKPIHVDDLLKLLEVVITQNSL
ncbi:MAG: response regulator [Bdellovibrionia bacterium]